MRTSHKSIALAFALVSVAAPFTRADVQYPSGTQDFEAMTVGEGIDTGLPPWFTVNTSSPLSLYTVVAADDVLGSQTPRGSSTKWLRVSDADSANVQNRFYSGAIVGPTVQDYAWTFYVNLEATPPGAGATKPKLTIQHSDTAGFANAWGIDFTDAGANLIVLGIGGTAASSPIYSLSSPTGLGEWVKIRLEVSFVNNTVSASVNDGPDVTLPINLSATADKKVFRFCYRGEGTGNFNLMLIDDVSFETIPPAPVPTVSEWGLALLTLAGLVVGAVLFGRKARVVNN